MEKEQNGPKKIENDENNLGEMAENYTAQIQRRKQT